MTDALRVFAFAVPASALILLVGKREKELAQVISGLLYLSVFVYAIVRLGSLLDALRALFGNADVAIPHADILLHAAGISLLCAAASALCEENGQRAASRALELLGIVEVILAAQPIFAEIFGIAGKMLLR